MGIYENLEKIKISVDEPFRFHCRMCGQCCFNREDILMTPKDLFHAAGILDLSVEEFVRLYCESYIGETSCMPLVRLKPQGTDRRCPLLGQDHKCTVQKAKPIVCAMYPVGRAFLLDRQSEEFCVQYFVQEHNCGDKSETHTVREWLNEFGYSPEDSFFVDWPKTIIFIAKRLIRLERKCTADQMRPIWSVVYEELYMGYDLCKDFNEQFMQRTKNLTEFITEREKTYGL